MQRLSDINMGPFIARKDIFVFTLGALALHIWVRPKYYTGRVSALKRQSWTLLG